jgi:O-methyltransferase
MANFEYQIFLAKKGLFKQAFHLAHRIFPKGGTCLEFGVFRGNSYLYQAMYIKEKYTNSKLAGFDSWMGLPDENPSVWRPRLHAKGEYCSTKDVVLEKLSKAGLTNDPRLSFVDGFFSESCTLELQKKFNDIIFINIDVDIYQSTIELLDFVKPLLRPGVILYWDDWKDPRATHEKSWGEHLAWDHWSAKNTDVKAELVETNWVNQRFTVITEANGKKLSAMALTVEQVKSMADELETSTGKLVKSLVKSKPVSGFLNFSFQMWGRIKPL